jgi:ribosomal protein S9
MADQIHAIGRRKEAVCRVYLTPGSGKWEINGRQLGDYFPRPALVTSIQLPFSSTDNLGKWDVKANLDGGGQAGQAGALRLAIARALVQERRDVPPEAARVRPPHARRPRGRAQEAGPPEGPQEVPVLEALSPRRLHLTRRPSRAPVPVA